MKRYILIIPFLIFLITFPGCAPRKATVPFKGYTLPPEDILKKISRTDNLGDILKALVHITVNTPRGKHSMKVALIAKMPSFLRAEVIPVIGTSNLFLSASGDSLKVFLPQKGEFYIGQATRKNLTMFFPINLKVEDIVSILVGTPPLVKRKNITLQGYLEDKLYRINVISQNKKVQSLWVDPYDNLVRIEVLDDDGRILYMVRLEDHSRIGGRSVPGKVMITIGETHKLSALIRYSHTQLSQDVDTTLFDLDIPPGIKPIYLD